MSALYYDITIEKRACFSLPLSLTTDSGSPVDLSGSLLKVQVRRNFDNALQASFVYSVLDSGQASVLLSLGTGDTLAIEEAASSYDVFIDTPDGCSEKILYGAAFISGNRTL